MLPRAATRVPIALPVLFLLLVLTASVARSAAIAADPSDLGQGLRFLRPATLTEISAAVSAPPALVLDLRAALADDGKSAAALADTLRARPAEKGVCLILLSPATAPALLAALTPAPPGCVTIGRADGACRPDIAVATDAAAEQRALAALASGTPPASLLPVSTDKPRHDEAELARDHAAGKTAAEDSDAPPAPKLPEPKATSPKAEAAATVTDAVLQRAVQVHRGLVALGRISRD